MNCKIYKNYDYMYENYIYPQEKQWEQLRIRKLKHPENKEYRQEFEEYNDSRNPVIYCDGQFHIEVIVGKSDTVIFPLCPVYTGKSIIEKVEEVDTETKKGKISYKNMTFDTFKGQNKKRLPSIYNFLNADIKILKNLILYGKNGTGKTHLAKAIQFETLQKGKISEFITLTELKTIFLETIRTNPNFNIESKKRLMQLEKADYLIIDDLATESTTEYFESQLTNLLDNRRGKLIVTTNLDIKTNDDFIKQQTNRDMFLNFRYDKRIISRLLDYSEFISLTGRDQRLKK
jgi:DNA replication protein DnaC